MLFNLAYGNPLQIKPNYNSIIQDENHNRNYNTLASQNLPKQQQLQTKDQILKLTTPKTPPNIGININYKNQSPFIEDIQQEIKQMEKITSYNEKMRMYIEDIRQTLVQQKVQEQQKQDLTNQGLADKQIQQYTSYQQNNVLLPKDINMNQYSINQVKQQQQKQQQIQKDIQTQSNDIQQTTLSSQSKSQSLISQDNISQNQRNNQNKNFQSISLQKSKVSLDQPNYSSDIYHDQFDKQDDEEEHALQLEQFQTNWQAEIQHLKFLMNPRIVFLSLDNQNFENYSIQMSIKNNDSTREQDYIFEVKNIIDFTVYLKFDIGQIRYAHKEQSKKFCIVMYANKWQQQNSVKEADETSKFTYIHIECSNPLKAECYINALNYFSTKIKEDIIKKMQKGSKIN